MKNTICIIAFFSLMVISSCGTTKSLSVNAGGVKSFPNYTLTILVWDAVITQGNTMNEVYEALSPAHILQADWNGSSDGNKKIKIKLQMPEELMRRLYTRLYAIPNIISVEIL